MRLLRGQPLQERSECIIDRIGVARLRVAVPRAGGDDYRILVLREIVWSISCNESDELPFLAAVLPRVLQER